MACERVSQRAVVGVCAAIFAAAAATTALWCASMAEMDDMAMPGGWTMSMIWMRMPGESWFTAAVAFLSMWNVMMVAMMLPSLVPTLWRYREVVGSSGAARAGWLSALVGAGYFAVWSFAGTAVFPLGVVLASFAMEQPGVARFVPIAAGVVVVIAGALQFTAWKARHLACCRAAAEHGGVTPANAGGAWRYGLRLGVHCVQCCAGPMVILVAVGLMDLGAMILIAVAVTAERLAPGGERVARAVGIASVATGLVMIARATALG